jgi:predicted short-subunit dehydrogenase-like oxidoreductase (DUF2520 family)
MKSPALQPGHVVLLGAGKVGSALYKGLRRAGRSVALRSLRRRGLPARVDATLLVLCARDSDLEFLAIELCGRVTKRTAVVHVAGALGPETLAPLRGHCRGIGQAHPLLSFAATGFAPEFKGAHLLVSGDEVAVRRARALGRALGMVPRSWPELDVQAYHAAAGLLANGTAALSGAAAKLLGAAGCPASDIGRVLGPLLRSVAQNVEQLGLPGALTGPIRRGDVRTVQTHLLAIARHAPELRALYLASANAQLPMAKALGDASGAALSTLRRELRAAVRRS